MRKGICTTNLTQYRKNIVILSPQMEWYTDNPRFLPQMAGAAGYAMQNMRADQKMGY